MNLNILPSTFDHRIIGFIICGAIILISVIIILIRYRKGK